MQQGKRHTRVILSGMTIRAVYVVLLVILCSPYIYWGVTRLLDVNAGIEEMEALGLLPPAPISAIAILIQLGASAMVITGLWRWIGALSLAVFTLAAALIAHPFWQVLPKDRFHEAVLFLGHMGLVGCFLIVVLSSLHERG